MTSYGGLRTVIRRASGASTCAFRRAPPQGPASPGCLQQDETQKCGTMLPSTGASARAHVPGHHHSDTSLAWLSLGSHRHTNSGCDQATQLQPN